MLSWLVAVFTDTEPVFFFCPKKIVMLTKLTFISIVLFQFGCFALSVEVFKAVYIKSMYSDPTISL